MSVHEARVPRGECTDDVSERRLVKKCCMRCWLKADSRSGLLLITRGEVAAAPRQGRGGAKADRRGGRAWPPS
eukprot:11881218-Alexandrium_andersonii.AAC.1